MAPESSSRLVAAMSDPGFYPHRPSQVELRETAISWVFLAGERVYKVKKPVVLPFLDYGSLDRRRDMCREEVRLNRRLAPDVYLGVRAIRRSGATLALQPATDGEVVEWAVEMRRLPEERTAVRLLRERQLDPGRLRALGRRLAVFHRRASPVSPREAGPATVGRMVRDNLRELYALPRTVVDPARLRPAARFAAAWLVANEAVIASRGRRARFREGHGDLRLEHVVFEDGIVVYDCVEFDPALRRIDVAADLAFLVMDLHEAGAAALAYELVSAYRDAGGDPGGDGYLSFYATYRALVRAKLHYLAAAELPKGAAEPDGERSAGDRLLALSERFAWRTRLPLVLVVWGISGSGKTTLAGELAEASALPHLSSDVVRKQLAGVAPREPAPAFRRERHRRAFLDALGGSDDVLFVECRAPKGVLIERARERAARGASVSDATEQVVERQLQELESLSDSEAARHVALDTDRTPGEIVDELLSVLDGHLADSGRPGPGRAGTCSWRPVKQER